MILQSKRVVVVRQRCGDCPGDENRLQISDGCLTLYSFVVFNICVLLLFGMYAVGVVCVEVKKKRWRVRSGGCPYPFILGSPPLSFCAHSVGQRGHRVYDGSTRHLSDQHIRALAYTVTLLSINIHFPPFSYFFSLSYCAVVFPQGGAEWHAVPVHRECGWLFHFGGLRWKHPWSGRGHYWLHATGNTPLYSVGMFFCMCVVWQRDAILAVMLTLKYFAWKSDLQNDRRALCGSKW